MINYTYDLAVLPETDSYAKYESRYSSVHRRMCINGKITGSCNCVGYCKYLEHPGFLTEELRKQHECIRKHCHYYIEKTKRKRDKSKDDETYIQKLINAANQIIKDYEGIKIVKANFDMVSGWILNYVTISSCYPIEKIANNISSLTGIKVQLKKLNYDFDICVKLIMNT